MSASQQLTKSGMTAPPCCPAARILLLRAGCLAFTVLATRDIHTAHFFVHPNSLFTSKPPYSLVTHDHTHNTFTTINYVRAWGGSTTISPHIHCNLRAARRPATTAPARRCCFAACCVTSIRSSHGATDRSQPAELVLSGDAARAAHVEPGHGGGHGRLPAGGGGH